MNKKLLVIDADTPLVRCAAVIQKNTVIVEHRISKRKKEFENITKFREFLGSDKGRGYAEDDFTITKKAEQIEPIQNAKHSLKLQIEGMANKPWADDYLLVIGGKDNFRYARTNTFVEYKANRPDKPLAYAELREWMIGKYKDRIVVADGEEADDYVCYRGWESYNKARKSKNKDDADVVIAYCDKDIPANTPGWMFNYNKEETEPYWNSDLEQTKLFAIQLLMGDKTTDGIPGIVTVDHRIFTKYGLKMTKGCGKVTAEGIVASATSKKEMIERVVDCYKLSWGDEWYYRMEENAFFLYLRRTEGEMFTLDNFLKGYGVSV